MIQTIEITITDGMVQHVDFPHGTRVIIRDYDVAGPDDSGDFDIQRDENGDFYERMVFSHAEDETASQPRNRKPKCRGREKRMKPCR